MANKQGKTYDYAELVSVRQVRRGTKIVYRLKKGRKTRRTVTKVVKEIR